MAVIVAVVAGAEVATADPYTSLAGTTGAGGEGVHRDELASYLNDYLRIDQFKDYGPNGLQVQGKERIRKLVTGVSACQELFVRAREASADAVMVHHGIFWDYSPSPLTGMQYRRVAELIRGDVNLLAYHLPLDAHPELGNNALAARAFGLENLEPFGLHNGQYIGFKGVFHDKVSTSVLAARCRQVYGAREPLILEGGEDFDIRSMGIISGGAQKELYQAIDAGLDAFLTGEVSEWVMNVARENRIHFISAGHYATEVCGITALGRHVAEEFGIEVEFIDIPNSV